jgi:hypothetical protein
MLLSFSVENFRSFKAEQTLSLMASKRLGPADSPHCWPVPGTSEHAIRVLSLYGPNGAGKSNLVRAIGLVKQMVLSGTSPGETLPYSPFLLDPDVSKAPAWFDLQFAEEGDVFRYSVGFDSLHIAEERLDVYEGTKERNLFTRLEGQGAGGPSVGVYLGPAAEGENGTPKIKALAEVGARRNQLFLTEVANLDDGMAQGPRLRRAISWFNSTLAVVEAGGDVAPAAAGVWRGGRFTEFAATFLREASTGIAGLRARTEEVPEATVISSWGPGMDILERTGSGLYRIRRVLAQHELAGGGQVEFPLAEESDGSRRLWSLLPALYRLSTGGGVFVIDEFERSMHPMLAKKFVEFFLKAGHGAAGQLIFTTHASTLLDLELMRRDGIWFADKDRGGATQLYSLADFKVRSDLRIEKGYLDGRFDAVPFLGGIDSLIEEQAAAEAGA